VESWPFRNDRRLRRSYKMLANALGDGTIFRCRAAGRSGFKRVPHAPACWKDISTKDRVCPNAHRTSECTTEMRALWKRGMRKVERPGLLRRTDANLDRPPSRYIYSEPCTAQRAQIYEESRKLEEFAAAGYASGYEEIARISALYAAEFGLEDALPEGGKPMRPAFMGAENRGIAGSSVTKRRRKCMNTAGRLNRAKRTCAESVSLLGE